MKKNVKWIVAIMVSIVLVAGIIVSVIMLSTPRYLNYDEIKDHINIFYQDDSVYITLDYQTTEVNYMSYSNGHEYLYSLEDGSRCYSQYLYATASAFDKLSSGGSQLYCYEINDIGAIHGVAIDYLSDEDEFIEYQCYTVAVYYMNEDGSTYLLWKADSYYEE